MAKTITFNELRRIRDRVHIEPGPDGGIVVLDDTTIYDMAVKILEENKKD